MKNALHQSKRIYKTPQVKLKLWPVSGSTVIEISWYLPIMTAVNNHARQLCFLKCFLERGVEEKTDLKIMENRLATTPRVQMTSPYFSHINNGHFERKSTLVNQII